LNVHDDNILTTLLDSIEMNRVSPEHVMSFVCDGFDSGWREAEAAVRAGDNTDAVEKLREMQAYTERLIAVLAPELKRRPRLVAVA
jgi:hypothetical protein